MDGAIASLVSIAAVFGLVLVNALFVAAEFALVRIRETRVNSPDFLSLFGAKSSLLLLRDLDGSISATQLGITIASLTLGWLGEETFAHLIMVGLGSMPETSKFVVSHGVATALALFVVTVLHVVIGELVAKSVAIRHPETVLRVLAPPMVFFFRFLKPFVIALNGLANLCLQILGLRGLVSEDRAHSATELAMLISQSTASGVLDKDEEEMIKGVFEFSHTVAREIMTPRTDLVSISHTASVEQVLAILAESGVSRLPVVGNGIDDVVGVLLAKDVLPNVKRYLAHHEEFDVTKIMRAPYFIPGTKPIDDLLREFKTRKTHIAIVLDEHGGVDGLVTLEDILEEIVGDIYDESEEPERNIVIRDDGDALVAGSVLVGDLNQRFEVQVPEGDYDTIAGFVFTHLGTIPVAGDRILIGDRGGIKTARSTQHPGTVIPGIVSKEPVLPPIDFSDSDIVQNPLALFTVLKVRGNRIHTVRLHLYPQKRESVESAAILSSSEGREERSVENADS